jgi:hypothetical protein
LSDFQIDYQVSFRVKIHLHHHHHRNEKREENFEKNLTESKAVAARIFNVNARSLIAFIQRNSGAKNERHNKMLQDHEINAFDDFIQSLLKHEILSTSEIVCTHQTGQRDDEKSSFYIC